VLIEQSALAPVEPPLSSLGGEARLLAIGIGDAEGTEAGCNIFGSAMRPPSPVHLRAERVPGGDLRVSWVRRSRAGWSWISGSDTPLGEEAESYRLTLSGIGFERSATVGAAYYLYTAEAQAADGLTGSLTISVTQTGTVASSRATTLVVNGLGE